MILGFTGTREDMVAAQLATLKRLLLELQPTEIRHGDCLGSDMAFHEMVTELLPGVRRVIHSPEKGLLRAWCVGEVILPEKPYLVRNQDIVNASDILIAASLTPKEPMRYSGTWACVRYARKIGKLVKVIWPDGSVTDH